MARSIDRPLKWLEDQEERRRNEWHERNMAARARRLEGVLATEAGRYSPQQVDAARKYLEETGHGQEGERRRQFDVQQETARTVSENNMKGMIGQGSVAAKERAAAERYIGELQHGTYRRDEDGNVMNDANGNPSRLAGSLEISADKAAAANQRLAETKAAAQKELGQMEHGYMGPDGKWVPGSRERVAEVQGETAIETQRNDGQTRRDVAQIQGKASVDAARAQAEALFEKAEDKNAQAEQKAFDAWRTSELDTSPSNSKKTLTPGELDDFRKMTPEEQKEFWRYKTGRAGAAGDVAEKNGVKFRIIRDANGKPIGKQRVK